MRNRLLTVIDLTADTDTHTNTSVKHHLSEVKEVNRSEVSEISEFHPTLFTQLLKAYKTYTHSTLSKRLREPRCNSPDRETSKMPRRNERAQANEAAVAEAFARRFFEDGAAREIAELHRKIDIDRTHIVVLDISSSFREFPASAEAAVSARVRTLCAGASDIVIALVFTAVMNQRNLSADYLEGSNAIAPLPSIQQMEQQVAEVRQDVADVRQDVEALRQEMRQEVGALRQEMRQEVGALRQEMRQSMEAILARLPNP